nr:DUF6415 family natural product biosynthesis protein [Streptomyces sp. MUM 203J]
MVRVGDLVEDQKTRRVGEVMGHCGPYVQLRPLGGGREWDARPDRLRLLSQEERLRLCVARDNARSRTVGTRPGQGPRGSAEPVLDLARMASAAKGLLSEDTDVPSPEEVQRLSLAYRGDLMVLIPAVQRAVVRLPKGAASGVRALAGVGEARARLDYAPSSALPAQIAHAQRLARAVLCLIRHLDHLAAEQ